MSLPLTTSTNQCYFGNSIGPCDILSEGQVIAVRQVSTAVDTICYASSRQSHHFGGKLQDEHFERWPWNGRNLCSIASLLMTGDLPMLWQHVGITASNAAHEVLCSLPPPQFFARTA